MLHKTTILANSITVNGIEYAPKTEQKETHISTEGMEYVMVRTYTAGVHFGYLAKKESTLAGMEVTLLQAQRMRYWEGAMDLSVLAMEGSTSPEKCKPSEIVTSIILVAIEIIPITQKAFVNLKSMKIWK